MSTQPQFDGEQADDQPADALDVYHQVSRPQASVDEFLEENNLGLGNITSESELWQQVERFYDGMYASAAFETKIVRRAIANAKAQLAMEGQSFWDDRQVDAVKVDGWRELDAEEQAEQSRREFVRETGEEIWNRMNNEQRVAALQEIEGISREWSPPHLRMLMAQHELGRSREAHTQDGVLGRVEKLVTSNDEGGDGGGGILGGGS